MNNLSEICLHFIVSKQIFYENHKISNDMIKKYLIKYECSNVVSNILKNSKFIQNKINKYHFYQYEDLCDKWRKENLSKEQIMCHENALKLLLS